MPIELKQPAGSDNYDIKVFNSNTQIIQDAINQLLDSASTNNYLNVFYYSEATQNQFNIDEVATGIHICNNVTESLLTGSYPDGDTKMYFEVFSFIKEDFVKIQLYINLTDNANTMFIRSALPSSNWSAWTTIGTGGGGEKPSSSGFSLKYVNTLDLESDSGIYIMNTSGEIVNGTLPSSVIDTSELQLISYGESFYGTKTQILTSISNGKNALYSRVKYGIDDGSGNKDYTWSAWKEIGADGSGGTSDIQITTVRL